MANLKTKEIWFLVLFAIIFGALGFSGLSQIYHQDEYRWATIANPIFNNFQSPHPPLTRYLLRATGMIFGFDHLRILPLFFGILNLFIVFLVSKFISRNYRTALWAAFLFAVSTYSLIAALQIDIDGAILPFFVLLSAYAYFKLLENQQKKSWWLVLLLAMIGGFFSKLSYILFILTILVDYSLKVLEKSGQDLRLVFKRIIRLITPILAFLILLYFLFASRFASVISYGEHFRILNFASRSYFDLGFKLVKSLVWFSPLLFLPLLTGLFSSALFRRYRFWFIYLIFNTLFYLVIFDFTALTIERYLMFLIAPACLIAAEVIERGLNGFAWSANKLKILGVLLLAVGLTGLVIFTRHTVLPLNPKSAYISYLKHLNLDFLIPLNGGSGPIGFYASAKYLFWSWLAVVLAWLGYLKTGKKIWMVTFCLIGISYNLLLTSEYLFGWVYGSAPRVARASVNYLIAHPSIKPIITYNDEGAYELNLSRQYLSRFYTAETRDYTKKLLEFRGYYLIVDFPEIDKAGRYWQILKSCKTVKEFEDKKITALILDCTNPSGQLTIKMLE